ncbi:MAG: methyltransferase domain-containing protein [Candidatus Aminicenantales bacterium]
MSQSFFERKKYHPDPRARFRLHSLRRVDKRLRAITSHVDLKGKSILDLGCSGGYFSFRFSPMARYVLGIDADRKIIEQNQVIVASRNYSNLEFRHATITPNLVGSLPDFDVVLFLSVFHHMLTASDAYEWNDLRRQQDAYNTMALIREKCRILVFEMGYPDEGYEWCTRLPVMSPNPEDWIIHNIFGDRFDKIQVIHAPAFAQGWGHIGQIIARRIKVQPLLTRIIRRIFGLDPRDNRDLYIGFKSL